VGAYLGSFCSSISNPVVELALCCGFNQPTDEDLPSLYLFSVLAGYSPVIECFHQ